MLNWFQTPPLPPRRCNRRCYKGWLKVLKRRKLIEINKFYRTLQEAKWTVLYPLSPWSFRNLKELMKIKEHLRKRRQTLENRRKIISFTWAQWKTEHDLHCFTLHCYAVILRRFALRFFALLFNDYGRYFLTIKNVKLFFFAFGLRNQALKAQGTRPGWFLEGPGSILFRSKPPVVLAPLGGA